MVSIRRVKQGETDRKQIAIGAVEVIFEKSLALYVLLVLVFTTLFSILMMAVAAFRGLRDENLIMQFANDNFLISNGLGLLCVISRNSLLGQYFRVKIKMSFFDKIYIYKKVYFLATFITLLQ